VYFLAYYGGSFLRLSVTALPGTVKLNRLRTVKENKKRQAEN
jgi:hypothetical protein